jgi:hypothetical protein
MRSSRKRVSERKCRFKSQALSSRRKVWALPQRRDIQKQLGNENPALGAHSLFKHFYPISNMAVAVEVARVRGAMLNRGYYSRISYVEPPLPELSPVKTSIKSDFNLYDLIKETQEYCRTERAKILEQLKKYKK